MSQNAQRVRRRSVTSSGMMESTSKQLAGRRLGCLDEEVAAVNRLPVTGPQNNAQGAELPSNVIAAKLFVSAT